MYAYSYLNTARSILERYHGELPFAAWLNDFFRKEKKYGSKDRKQISHLCYCYFRGANALKHLNPEQQIIWSLFLCSPGPNPLLGALDEALNHRAALPLEEKLLTAEPPVLLQNVFPWKDELSEAVSYNGLCRSIFSQPDLFLRIRPGRKEKVTEALEAAGASFEFEGDDCLRLPNTTKLQDLVALDEDVVVQDRNSQRTLDALPATFFQQKLKVWDCCAASGGKSMLLLDRAGKVQLLATDIRASILHNLTKRFEKAGIKNYRTRVYDVSKERLNESFDLVICDAPCSGSGTWSRTPEQLFFFNGKKIGHYAALQKGILINAAASVKPAGYLLYITCSVFKKENEAAVDFVLHNTALELLSQQYLTGYENKADTLFTALFKL